MNMSMRLASISSGLVLAAAAAFACSDDKTSTPAGTDDAGSSSSSSGSSGSSTDGGSSRVDAEAGPATLNGCTSFADRSADGASRVVEWNTTLFQREERCMQIKKGQKVTFAADANGATPGDFTMHPLSARGGDSPNPVDTALDQATGEVTFAAAGDFGYVCDIHPAMIGAIKVIE